MREREREREMERKLSRVERAYQKIQNTPESHLFHLQFDFIPDSPQFFHFIKEKVPAKPSLALALERSINFVNCKAKEFFKPKGHRIISIDTSHSNSLNC